MREKEIEATFQEWHKRCYGWFPSGGIPMVIQQCQDDALLDQNDLVCARWIAWKAAWKLSKVEEPETVFTDDDTCCFCRARRAYMEALEEES